jgi:hypothetical protein
MSVPGPSTQVRLYPQRASYDLRAAREIFRECPVAHVAFILPAEEGKRAETIMNLPLILVIMKNDAKDDESDEDENEVNDDDEEEFGGYAVYLHTSVITFYRILWS